MRRTGEATAASRSASQRSAGVSSVSAAPAASERRVTSAAGKRAEGSGSREESRNACSTRPSSRACTISCSQVLRSLVTRSSSASRSWRRSSRPSSSWGAAPTTAARRSRSVIWSRWATAATARSAPRRLANPREELLGNSQDRLTGCGRAALPLRRGLLLSEGATHGGEAADRQLLGNGAALGRQGGEQAIKVRRAGHESRRPRLPSSSQPLSLRRAGLPDALAPSCWAQRRANAGGARPRRCARG